MSGSDNTLQSYLSEISSNPVLTKDQEQGLFGRIRENNDPDAREKVIECNLKFVIQIAQRFRARGLALEDLIQEGNIGLLEAVNKFDHNLGFRFSTYAAFWIRQSIQVAIRQRGSLIRIPVRKARMLGFMSEVMQEFWSTKGRAPNEIELAERLEITPIQARELAQLGETVLSLDSPVEEGGVPLIDLVADTRPDPAEEQAVELERRSHLNTAMKMLTDRELKVISHRFGLGRSGVSHSLRKVSSSLGLSQEGVRRIEQRALAKLRRPQVRQGMAGLL